MTDDQLMYVLEAIAYLSASIAAFVYVWETCSPRKKRMRYIKNSGSSMHEDKLINRSPNTPSRRSSSSMYDDF
jgi:hypothetical protein